MSMAIFVPWANPNRMTKVEVGVDMKPKAFFLLLFAFVPWPRKGGHA
jgi:hypothetical protein